MAAPWSSCAAPRRMKQDVWLLPTQRPHAAQADGVRQEVDGESPRALGEMGCGEEGCEDVQLSPDGQFAVWAARKQLWIAPVSGATPAHQLTDLPGNSTSPRWSPDGHHIAFVSDRGDHSFIGDLRFRPRLGPLPRGFGRSRRLAAMVSRRQAGRVSCARRAQAKAGADSRRADAVVDLGGRRRQRRRHIKCGKAANKLEDSFPS